MNAKIDKSCCGPGYASPTEAIKAPNEKILYTIAIYTGTGIQKPDYLATIDVDPDSPNYSKVIHRLEMPGIGDELHHMGWNACSSCHGDSGMSRKYLLVPGVRSNNIYVIDTATDPLAPRIYKVIKGSEIKSKTMYKHININNKIIIFLIFIYFYKLVFFFQEMLKFPLLHPLPSY